MKEKHEKAEGKKLKESDGIWHSLTENTDDTVMIIDNKKMIQYVNKTIPPTTPEIVVGKSVYDYVSKEQHNLMRKSLEKVFKTGKPDSYEVSLNMANINPKIGALWYRTKVIPVQSSKKVTGMILIATDITARKKTEHALGERVKELNTLYSLSKLVERPGISFKEICEELVKLIPLGLQYPEITVARIKTNYGEFKTRKFKETKWKQSANIGDFGKIEVYYLEKKLEADEGPFFKEERNLLNELADELRRIIERKKVEEKMLIRSKIITNMSEGVHLVRAKDGIIVYTNPMFEKMFGYEPGEMLGKNISIVNAPTEKSPEKIAKEITAYLKKQGTWKGEILNIKKDGTPFWSYATISVLDHPEHGKVFVSVHMDITERKKSEEELKKKNEELERFNKIAVGRELRMIELKKKIKSLEAQLKKKKG